MPLDQRAEGHVNPTGDLSEADRPSLDGCDRVESVRADPRERSPAPRAGDPEGAQPTRDRYAGGRQTENQNEVHDVSPTLMSTIRLIVSDPATTMRAATTR